MSKPICLLYRMVVALVLLLAGAAATAVAFLLFSSRAASGAWSGPGAPDTALLDRSTAWLTQQAAMHGAVAAAAAVALALLCLLLLYFVLRSVFRRTPRLVLSRGSLGEVAIDLRQVGLLAQHEAESVSGVREVNTEAAAAKSGLDLQQTLVVEPQTPFAPLAEQVQQRVKQSLEFHLGLPVARVQVLLQHASTQRGPL